MKKIVIALFFVGLYGGSFVGVNLALTKFSESPQGEAPIELTIAEIETDVLAAETIANPQIESLETEVETPTQAALETVTPIPTATPTAMPRPTSTPPPTPVPQPVYSDQEVNEFIESFSTQYGLDPNVVRHIAQCESGFNQTAVNGAYAGLFQFGTSAWVTARAQMGESADLSIRLNAEESVHTASYHLSQGRTDLWPNCMP